MIHNMSQQNKLNRGIVTDIYIVSSELQFVIGIFAAKFNNWSKNLNVKVIE